MARSVYLCPGTRSLALRNRALVLGTSTDPACLCEQPEACCHNNGICDLLTPSECIRQRGQPMGPGTDCNGRDCEGACCIGDGVCVRMGFGPCYEQNVGGTWGGFGSQCTPNPCPVIGACCNGGACTQTTAAGCAGTWFQGQSCSPNPCPPACCVPNQCCYRPQINVQSIATLSTQFTLRFKQCCVNVFRSCPTFSPAPVVAAQTFPGAPAQCVGVPAINLTTTTNQANSGPMPCPGTNCNDPWVFGWSASVAYDTPVCTAGVLSITRRVKSNTDPAAITSEQFGCNLLTQSGTDIQRQFEFCGAGQNKQEFDWSSTLTVTNLAPCHPAGFRDYEFRTSAGGIIIPPVGLFPPPRMNLRSSGSGSSIVTSGCSGCGGGLLTGGSLL